MTWQQVLDWLLILQKNGVDLENFNATAEINGEYFPISGGELTEDLDVLDHGHPVLSVDW